MKNIDWKFIGQVLLLIFYMMLLMFTRDVLGKEEVRKIKFHEYIAGGGDYRTIIDSEQKMEYDYMKVVVKGKYGDTFDVRLKYTPDWFITKKTLAVKKGLVGKKFKVNTVYFIPQKGKCPGKKNECVRVPVKEGLSTEDKIIDSTETLWGIEIYNGSAKNLLMDTKGYYSFMNYEEK